MLPYTTAQPPHENGALANRNPIPLGEHIAIPEPPRNIKQSGGWLWQEKAALRKLADSYTGERLRAARSVYLALTEVASNQFTPDRAHTSCAYLGQLAGLGENAVRRYLHEFATLGLIQSQPAPHRANTYLLLAVSESKRPANIEVSEMKLSDSIGVSHAAVSDAASLGITGDTPNPSKHHRQPTIGGETLGTRGGSQSIRISQNKNKLQTNRQGGVAPVANVTDATTTSAATNPHIAANDTEPCCNEAVTHAPTVVPDAAITALNSLGVRREVAEKLAAECDEQTVLDWVYYAKRADGLKSRAGFVLAMLRQGQTPPPSTHPPLTSYSPPQTASEPLQGLTGLSPQEDEPPLTEVSTPPHPTAQQQAIWHTVKRELIASASSGAKLWLEHMRLIAADDDRWLLSSPPTGRSSCNPDAYADEIASLLYLLLRRRVTVEFQLGW